MNIRYFLFLLFPFTIQLLAAQTWTHVPSPNPSPVRSLLRGISGTSENDIWTVGHYETTPTGGNYSQDNLVMHWTGSSWTVVTVPPPPTASDFNDLWDVHSITTTNAWAVGNYSGAGSGSLSQILHYDGSSWTQENLNIASNTNFLWSLDAISANDIWAVGGQAGTLISPCLAMHYNGSSWNEVPVPPVGQRRNRFVAVDGISSNDVWAVGSWGHVLGNFHFLTMHWDGSSWSSFSVPANLSGNIGELLDVHMIASNDVWAVGSLTAGGMVLLHWDGTSWSEVQNLGGGGALIARNANDLFAVGEKIVHWDGNSWQVHDSLTTHIYPALISAVLLPSGEIWAAGVRVDFNTVFETLVVRSGVQTSIAENNSLAGMMIHPNPFFDNISVQIESTRNEVATLRIYTVDKKLVKEHIQKLNAGFNSIHISGDTFSEGVYFMHITSGKDHRVEKLVKY